MQLSEKYNDSIMFGINKTVYKNMMDYFKNNIHIYQVIIFGSRAKGCYKYNSDIDLCISCDEKRRGSISEDIDDIVGIYSCDIVFEGHTNSELKEQIERFGKSMYSRETTQE
ncbi:MAG: nucleotidyltransferase domain-containing protein [Inconstantimicrobium porci]|nr:nucleotidyltransferase domain-containing protein [Inconstantimicrobium porci]MDY5911421.1 nucleotidyltransferase domain-containing protein [Inconstantimicrobium porci]